MSKKEISNGEKFIGLLVTIRNEIDNYINEVAPLVISQEPNTPESATEAKKGDITGVVSVPKFTAEDYNKLGWQAFQTRKNQTWEKIALVQYAHPTLNAIKNDLVDCCSNPEATIQAPMLAYDYGYWIFKDAMYRRKIETPK